MVTSPEFLSHTLPFQYCEAYNDIRNLYIDRDALTCANEYNFVKLMNADNTDCIVKLANFVSYMFKIRQQLYDSLQP